MVTKKLSLPYCNNIFSKFSNLVQKKNLLGLETPLLLYIYNDPKLMTGLYSVQRRIYYGMFVYSTWYLFISFFHPSSLSDLRRASSIAGTATSYV